MVKRSFIPCVQNKKQIKIYVDDIKKIHNFSRKNKPKLPSYKGKDSITDW